MKISIIIPFYNTNTLFLKPLFNQLELLDSNKFEIIFINDGSNEDCSSFVRINCKKNNFKYISQNQNSGVSSCRNIGIKNASGDYLFFVDSDDLLNIDILNKAYFVLTGELIIFTSGIFFNELKTIASDDLNNVKEDSLTDLLLNEKYIGIAMKSACSKFFSRDFIIKNKLYFDESLPFYEDYLFMSHVYSLSPKFGVFNNVIYYYRLHEGSSSKRFNKAYIDKYQIFFDTYIKQFISKEFLISLYSTTFNSMFTDKVVRSFKKGHYFYCFKISNAKCIYDSALFLYQNNLLTTDFKKKLARLIIKQHTIRAVNNIIIHQFMSSLKIKLKRLLKK